MILQNSHIFVRILRDTVSTLLFMDVIPLSENTFMGSDALIQGVECGFLNVPLHVVNLKSDFVNGPETVGVMFFYLLLVFSCCLIMTLLEIRL